MIKTSLQILMEEDGVHIPSHGEERAILCPFHEDTDPSASINVVKGVFFCQGCGAGGNAYQYVMKSRNLSPRDATKLLREEMGATEGNINTFHAEEAARKRKNARKLVETQYPFSKTKMKIEDKDQVSRVALYDYTDQHGKTIFQVGRYEKPREGRKPKKKFLLFTLKADGSGFFLCSPLSDRLPLHERRSKLPLYKLQLLSQIENLERQVWLVEGEKCVEIASKCKAPKGNTPIVTCLPGGTQKDLDEFDLEPLHGRNILIFADADAKGHKYAKKVGLYLKQHGCIVRYCLPKIDEEADGYDIADAISYNGWQGLTEFIESGKGVLRHDEVFSTTDEVKLIDPPNNVKPSPDRELLECNHFKILGYDGGGRYIVFQTKKLGYIHRYNLKELSNSSILFSLAPKEFWEEMNHNANKRILGAAFKDEIVNIFHEAAKQKGEINIQGLMTWGRGAHRTMDGDVVYNIGSSLLTTDSNGYLTVEKNLIPEDHTGDIYEPGPKVDILDDKYAAIYLQDLYNAVLAYRWEKPEHGMAFLGWIVTSLVGGALPFRPMVWLTAEAESGKSFLMQFILKPVLKGLITDIVNGTEAGMASQAANNSLPFYLDEFEPEKGKELQQNNILSLVRMATSGDASRVRGSPSGDSSNTRPRFSLFMSSISRPSLSDADDSRIVHIKLSRKPVADWVTVKRDILNATKPEVCKAIRTSIIRNAKLIADHTLQIEEEFLGSKMGTRESQIMASLSAGLAFMTGDRNTRLNMSREEKKTSKQYDPLDIILSSYIKVNDWQRNITLGEVIRRGFFSQGTFTLDSNTDYGPSTEACADAAKNVGIIGDDITKDLIFSRGSFHIKDILKGKAYENIDIDEYLLSLPKAFLGVNSKGVPLQRRFGAGIRKTYTVIPFWTLIDMGYFDEDHKSNPDPVQSFPDLPDDYEPPF